MKKKIFKMLIVLSLSLGVLGFFSLKTTNATAGGGNVTGFAWSSNVGWISFNCSNLNTCGTLSYGVSVDPSGNFSGYAWDSNLGENGSSAGWLSFNSADTAACGANAHLDLNSGNITGWAKFMTTSGANDGGWNGCVHLSPSSGSSYGLNYHSNENNNNVHGFAWGSTVAGWVSFHGSTYGVTIMMAPASLYLQSGANVVYGPSFSTTLTWGSQTNTAFQSCTPTDSLSGAGTSWQGTTIAFPTALNPGPLSTTITVPPAGANYALDCTPIGGGALVQSSPHFVHIIRGYNSGIGIGYSNCSPVNAQAPNGNWHATISWTSTDLATNSCSKTGGWSGSGLACSGVTPNVIFPAAGATFNINGTGLDQASYSASTTLSSLICSANPSQTPTIHPKFKEK